MIFTHCFISCFAVIQVSVAQSRSVLVIMAQIRKLGKTLCYILAALVVTFRCVTKPGRQIGTAVIILSNFLSRSRALEKPPQLLHFKMEKKQYFVMLGFHDRDL